MDAQSLLAWLEGIAGIGPQDVRLAKLEEALTPAQRQLLTMLAQLSIAENLESIALDLRELSEVFGVRS